MGKDRIERNGGEENDYFEDSNWMLEIPLFFM